MAGMNLIQPRDELSQEDIDMIRSLRVNGFAVIVWTPEELRGADPDHVEDRLIELGWDVIDCLAEDEKEGEK